MMQNATWGFERRRAPRRSADALVDVMGRQVVNGTVEDISATGLRARLSRPVHIGERRLLRVFDKERGEQLRWGQVVWARRQGDSYQVGMRFCSMRSSRHWPAGI